MANLSAINRRDGSVLFLMVIDGNNSNNLLSRKKKKHGRLIKNNQLIRVK